MHIKVRCLGFSFKIVSQKLSDLAFVFCILHLRNANYRAVLGLLRHG